MNKAYEIWLETMKMESKPTTIYTATYKNKEVRIYSIDSRIFISWYINGKLIEKALFPKEIITDIDLFFQTVYAKCINKQLMCKILSIMKKCLPYLEDGENLVGSIKNIEIMREIKLE